MLKAALGGSLVAFSDNLLIYATSNRRHLMLESIQATLPPNMQETRFIPLKVSRKKISLSERFGLWVSFYRFSQDEYRAIVAYCLQHLGFLDEMDAAAREVVLQWSIHRGTRSGRVGGQFARDWAGRG